MERGPEDVDRLDAQKVRFECTAGEMMRGDCSRILGEKVWAREQEEMFGCLIRRTW